MATSMHDLQARQAIICSDYRIRGGSDSSESMIVEHLRTLVADERLPRKAPSKAFVGPNRDRHSCIACDGKLGSGEIEFETIGQSGEPIYLHRRCFELWRLNFDAPSAA